MEILLIILIIFLIINTISLFFYLKYYKLHYEKNWLNNFYIPKQECTIIIITINNEIYTGYFKMINHQKYFCMNQFKNQMIQWKYIKNWIYKYNYIVKE